MLTCSTYNALCELGKAVEAVFIAKESTPMANVMLVGPQNVSFCDARSIARLARETRIKLRFVAHGGQWDDARFTDRFPACSKFPPSSD
jgi:hypothetical protein